MDEGFDLTVFQELHVDHGFTVPLSVWTPEPGDAWPCPVIPLLVNVIQYPQPTGRAVLRARAGARPGDPELSGGHHRRHPRHRWHVAPARRCPGGVHQPGVRRPVDGGDREGPDRARPMSREELIRAGRLRGHRADHVADHAGSDERADRRRCTRTTSCLRPTPPPASPCSTTGYPSPPERRRTAGRRGPGTIGPGARLLGRVGSDVLVGSWRSVGAGGTTSPRAVVLPREVDEGDGRHDGADLHLLVLLDRRLRRDRLLAPDDGHLGARLGERRVDAWRGRP